jgi:hypothetical protein
MSDEWTHVSQGRGRKRGKRANRAAATASSSSSSPQQRQQREHTIRSVLADVAADDAAFVARTAGDQTKQLAFHVAIIERRMRALADTPLLAELVATLRGELRALVDAAAAATTTVAVGDDAAAPVAATVAAAIDVADAVADTAATVQNEAPPLDVDVVCYGIGRFATCVRAQLQFACFLLLRRQPFLLTGAATVYDPVMGVVERRVAAHFGVATAAANEEARRVCERPTLFYMPHCGLPLYDNLLVANWTRARLSCLCILGNRFSMYAMRAAAAAAAANNNNNNKHDDDNSRDVDNAAAAPVPRLAAFRAVAAFVRQTDVLAGDRYTDAVGVFNDSAVHRVVFDDADDVDVAALLATPLRAPVVTTTTSTSDASTAACDPEVITAAETAAACT